MTLSGVMVGMCLVLVLLPLSLGRALEIAIALALAFWSFVFGVVVSAPKAARGSAPS